MASGRRFWQPARMARTILLYALALAVGAGLLQWLEYRYVTRIFPTEIYIALLAVGFVGQGGGSAAS